MTPLVLDTQDPPAVTPSQEIDLPAFLSAQPTDYRHVVIHVSGGFDGALRIATLLRGRRYRVCEFAVSVDDSTETCKVHTTVAAGADGTDLLLARLRRLPAVHSAQEA